MYNKVQQFVEAAGIINVSMGDVLGDDATLAIGKMVDVYKKSTDTLKDKSLKMNFVPFLSRNKTIKTTDFQSVISIFDAPFTIGKKRCIFL